MFSDPGAWVQPDQMAKEFAALLDIYKAHAPKYVLEIGVREGGTFFQWMKHARPDTTIIGIDFPIGKWGNQNQPEYKLLWDYAGYRSVIINMILGDSHHPMTKEGICGTIPRVDFLFIDGDHSYKGVKDDFEFYSGLMSPGGIVAIHDILPNTDDRNIEVPRYWAELKERYTCQELTSYDNQDGRGIGVIYL
jgi:predicted O-methyltransferase YrrM